MIARLRIRRNLFFSGMEDMMHGIVYIIGLIVVVLAILSFFGLR